MIFAEEMEERGIQKAKLKRLLKGMLEGKARGKQEGKARGKQEGKIEGKKEGITERKTDTALKMLNEGVELAFISKVTDFSLAELKRLQEKK